LVGTFIELNLATVSLTTDQAGAYVALAQYQNGALVDDRRKRP